MTSNQVISTMFDISTSIHMARIIPHWDWDKYPQNALLTLKIATMSMLVDDFQALLFIYNNNNNKLVGGTPLYTSGAMMDMLHLYILFSIMMMPTQSSIVDDSSHDFIPYEDIR
jgi:hypothetical protein